MPATMMSTDQPWNVEITAVTYTCISSALICHAWQTHKTTNRPFFSSYRFGSSLQNMVRCRQRWGQQQPARGFWTLPRKSSVLKGCLGCGVGLRRHSYDPLCTEVRHATVATAGGLAFSTKTLPFNRTLTLTLIWHAADLS